MKTPLLLDGLSDIAERYDALFCDVWGVLHDGVTVFPGAAEALLAFRAEGRPVVLVSNVPLPSDDVLPMLDRIGVPRNAYDRLLSSGDMTRRLLAERPGARVHHLGPTEDSATLDGLDLIRVSLDQAEVIVCTGLVDDRREQPENYRDRLAPLVERRVPFICANPDYVVDVGGTLYYCAGALADLYRAMGGESIYCGKPYPLIYEAARETAAAALGRPLEHNRILAIGDAMRTDMAGAARFGIDALFVASGIHAAETAGSGGPDPARLIRLFKEHDARPVGAQWRLSW